MRYSLAPKLATLVSASLLAVGYSQVRAQSDDIPETVLITGSLIRGVIPPPTDERLTQLVDRELKAILPGTRIRAYIPGYANHSPYELDCDGNWSQAIQAIVLFVDRGRYSIRNNQVCIERQAGASGFCAKFFRTAESKLFSDLPGPLPGIRPVEIVPPDRACAGR